VSSPRKQRDPHCGVSSFVRTWPLHNLMHSLHLDRLIHSTDLHFHSDLPCSLQSHAFLNTECCVHTYVGQLQRTEGAALKSHSNTFTHTQARTDVQEKRDFAHILYAAAIRQDSLLICQSSTNHFHRAYSVSSYGIL